jgi:Prenyltransferase and squalene oxidase repeat
MRTISFLSVLAGSLALLGFNAAAVRADEIPAEYKESIRKGLEYLAKQQHKDGHWESFGGQYPITMTGISGMAMLMEGSTMREGKYKDNIKRAVDYLMSKVQIGGPSDGMIGSPNMPGESGRYMYGHGFALLFLSCVYGEEEEGERRKRLEDMLTRAAKFSHAAQTDQGGWGYVSAKEGGGFDEGSVTITQVQALRAARNAGIPVPPNAIKMAQDYLKKSTTPDGGVIYSLRQGGAFNGGGRPALTAAAISCGFSSGDYKSELVKKWFKFCQGQLRTLGDGRMGHDEYTHYYYSQAVYIIGDKGWKEMFPSDTADQAVTWSKYRKVTFDNLVRTQGADGSWNGTHAGNIFATAAYLTMMQLDGAVLPIYQR